MVVINPISEDQAMMLHHAIAVLRSAANFFAALLVAAHALVACAVSPVLAQAYPTRPVVIVVPFAAGGGNDVLARLLAQRMSAALGQQFVVENRPGAGGTLGARAVAKAAPDGYTLMVGHSGVFAIAPSLYANPGYDPRKDFAPIGLIGSYQQVLVVHPSIPVRTVADLVALAKKEPGKLTYATAGVGSGSHLSTELFAALADVKLTHVPYRGTGAMQADLAGGHVAMSITTLPSVVASVRGGMLRAVAVTDAVRSPMLPELPTIAEAGVPGYAAVIHYGIVAPAGTDRAIVGRLNAELRAALLSEEVRARIADEGGDPLPGTPEQQAADIDAEETKWGALVKKLGIKAE
jgi:tripartite-type tricarboxylate transporter receptor subunit TctC